jgi:hypothetical protein
MLSEPQFKEKASIELNGAMPMDSKFDGAAPIKTPEPNGEMAAHKSMSVAKPGFF